MATNEKVTFNRLITDSAEGLLENTQDFVAMQAFGVATVAKRMGEYPRFKIEDLYRNSLRKRAVGSQYAETATDIEMKNFVCADYGVEEAIADETIAEMGAGYKQEIADKLMIDAYRNYEQVVMDFAFDKNNWDLVLTGASATDLSQNKFEKFNIGTANICDLMRKVKAQVKVACGRTPNKAVMTSDVMDALLENAYIRDLLAVTKDQFIDQAFLAKAFGLDAIYVTDGIINQANIGAKDMTHMHEKTMLLYWDGQAGRNSLTAPCAMKVVRLNYGDTNSASGVGIYERRDDSRDVDILRVKQRFAPIVQYSEAGVLFTECI